MRACLLLFVVLLCAAPPAIAQEADTARTLLPAGTRVRIEYRNAHDVTVGTLVRGGTDTLIVRPESVQRDARFLTKDVHVFEWWYSHSRMSAPDNSGGNWLATVAVVTLAGIGIGFASSDTHAVGGIFGPLDLPLALLALGGATYIVVHVAAPGGEWVRQPLSEVKFANASARVAGASVALTIRR